jgi:PPOX class probable F420-dependent enzyme
VRLAESLLTAVPTRVHRRRLRGACNPPEPLPGADVGMGVSSNWHYRSVVRQPSLCFLATVMPDGSPQVTQTWVDTDGEHVVINSVRGHQKVKNVERDPRVAVNVCDVSSPSRYYAIRGRVIGITAEGGAEHIEALARRYLGPPYRGTGAATKSASSLPSRRPGSATAGGRGSVTISQPGNNCAHLDPASTGGSSTEVRKRFTPAGAGSSAPCAGSPRMPLRCPSRH